MDIQNLTIHDMMQLRLGNLTDDQLREMHEVLKPLHKQYLRDYMRRCDDGDYSESEEERCVKYLYVNINNFLAGYTYGVTSSATMIIQPADVLAAQCAQDERTRQKLAFDKQYETPQRTELLHASAYRLVNQGLVVVPLQRYDHKVPSIKVSELPDGGYTTAQQVHKHWHNWDGHELDGIAIRTGVKHTSGYIPLVIDLDMHGNNGRAELRRWLQANPSMIPVQPALCASTDGTDSGLHIHIAVYAEAVISCIGVINGVDILAAGRQCVMPPTYRYDKQVMYKWLGLYDWITDTIQPLPADQLPSAKTNILPYTIDNNYAYYNLLAALYARHEAKQRVLRLWDMQTIKAQAAALNASAEELIDELIKTMDK